MQTSPAASYRDSEPQGATATSEKERGQASTQNQSRRVPVGYSLECERFQLPRRELVCDVSPPDLLYVHTVALMAVPLSEVKREVVP